MIQFKKVFFHLCLIVFLFASCVPQRKMVYVQPPEDSMPVDEFSLGKKQNYTIQPSDLLYISFGNAGQQDYNFFNQEKQYYNTLSESSLSVLAYPVDETGNVNLPIIGKVKLQNLTLDEATDVIKIAAMHILSDPIVSVRFANNTITILGYVANPGTYIYSKQNLTIFQALGLSGDITEYGNRKEVILIRELNKKNYKYSIDLTADDLLKSDLYYIRPNDIIYISPLKIRWFGFTEIPWQLIVSSVTAAFAVLIFFKP